MKKIRRHSVIKFFWGMLALHIFNLSIDSPDLHQKENLKYNDVESIVELVLENVFDIENAIEEHDDADDTHQLKFEKKIDFYFEFPLIVYLAPIPTTIYQRIPFADSFFINNALGELFQPPEHSARA